MTDTLGSESHNTDLEVYKLAVEMADRVSARRAVANSFYLALHSALVAGLLVSISEREPDASLRGILLACATFPGLLLAVLWRSSLTSYRRLNEAKYAVITEMERTMLAASARPYADEWEKLQVKARSGNKPKHKELGWAERQVPLVFMFAYMGIGLGIAINASI